MECIHFPDGGGGGICSICKNGVAEDKARRPDNWWFTAGTGYKQDPGDVLLEGIVGGSVCPRCQTSRVPIGCTCNRARIFAEDMRQAAQFCETAPEIGVEQGIQFTADEATHVVMSAFKRASRRVDWDSEEELRDTRQGLAEEFGVDPKKAQWHPSRNVEPTPLPV